MALAGAVILAACQPALRPAIGAAIGPDVGAEARPSAGAADSGSSGTASAATNDPAVELTSDAALARTIAGVFGDSAEPAGPAGPLDDGPVWDIDVRSYETHDRVLHYVRLFTGTARERFTERLSRGTRYEPMIRAKLRAAGMPEDLSYLALIESGYDPNAYSRAAAVGMWQFMTSTAKGVGLRVDWWVDERRDPARATDAAIRFLGSLQQQFGSLYLAAAAYNGGPGRVARGLTRFAEELDGTEGDDRFFALAEQDYLHSETKNYVPQLIAAAIVAKTPDRFGLSVTPQAPYAYDSVQVGPGTSLAAVTRAAGVSVAEVRELNPALLRGVAPPDASVWVRVPPGVGARVAAELDGLPAGALRGYRTATARKGETLAAIARREGMAASQLAWFNPGVRRSAKGVLVAGQAIRIPEREVLAFARDVPNPVAERAVATGSLVRAGIHVVRPGESLGTIARRYGTTTARLKAVNGLRGDRILAGQTLRVSGGTAAARATATTRTAAGRASTAAGRGATAADRPATHVVRRGESLSGIAQRNGTTVARLKTLNGLRSDRLREGQRLRIR